jgi:hypothetical protein
MIVSGEGHHCQRSKARYPWSRLLIDALHDRVHPPRSKSCCRLDVLVQVKQVTGVVFLLDLSQSLEIGAVGRADSVGFLFGHEIDVEATHGVWLSGLEEIA